MVLTNTSKNFNINLNELEKKIDIKFNNVDIIIASLTHDSFYTKHKYSKFSNQRLEFIGDRVLSFIISLELFKSFPNYSAGDLSKHHSYLVSMYVLHEIAEKLNIREHICHVNNSITKSVLADCVEALIAAIYIDQGLEKATEFVLEHWSKYFAQNLNEISIIINPKPYIEAFINNNNISSYNYTLLKQEGAENNLTFYIELKVGDYDPVYSASNTIKQAEKLAAIEFIKRYMS